MDRHRRVDRTLFCLVVSMTFGALVLHWIQPDRSAGLAYGTDLIGVIRQPWHAIHIDPQAEPSRDAQPTAHFLVDRDGKRLPTEKWQAQRNIGAQGVVRIGLEALPDSHDVTGIQRAAVESLIEALQHKCRISPDRVLWDDALAIPPPAPQAVLSRPVPSQSRRAPEAL